ncbi:MAG: Na/Pi cotransporter family protein [Synergistes sp.]|nr:Na/Pi cotransporter family protein [Synergistes sp.]
MSVENFLQAFAGVGILIYGIIIMGESLQIIAGDKLRKLIGSLTGTTLKGVLVGTLVTAILQSSSATTVMVVSLVDVGFMNLVQAIGVILGANIGTTITGQLIAFDITDFAYVCAFVGAGVCMLCQTKRKKQIGIGIIGFALLFIGMKMMQTPFSFLKERSDILAAFADNQLLAFMAGLVITLIVQSSAATVGLTMAIAAQGVIPLSTAVVIIMGDNIGTTITAVLASLGANRAAKQAAAAHVLIKILGTVVISLFIPYYTALVEMSASTITRQIANAHTFFNITIAILFFPFVRQYASFIRKIIPDGKTSEQMGVIYLNRSLISVSAAAAVEAVEKEMVRLAKTCVLMIEDCRRMIVDGEEGLAEGVGRMENGVNDVTREIIDYSTETGQSGLSTDLSKLLNLCTNSVGDIERVGDHAMNLVEMQQYLEDNSLSLSEKAKAEGNEMFTLVLSALSKSIEALEKEDVNIAREVIETEKKIDAMEKTLRAKHVERLNKGLCSPGAAVIFIDILSNLERVGDHANNIANAVFEIDALHHKTKMCK